MSRIAPLRTWLTRLTRPLVTASTYTRAFHLFTALALGVAVALVYPGLEGDSGPADGLALLVVPIPILIVFGLLAEARRFEGFLARLLLRPGDESDIAVTRSQGWGDRWRTALWLVLRVDLAWLGLALTGHWVFVGIAMIMSPATDTGVAFGGLAFAGGAEHWWLIPLGALVIVGALYYLAGVGWLLTRLGTRLLGPSATERLAIAERRTEQLLEHNRLARELHDSIGHALSVTVLQAGAARQLLDTDPAFADRALEAIEETGRQALEDLERMLLLLRDAPEPAAPRPGLSELKVLVDGTRGAGASVELRVAGAVDAVPAVISREGYRIVQESLTNVLRHAGPVPVDVTVAVDEHDVELTVLSSAPAAGVERRVVGAGSGSGLRGIRERAALLGGEATAGAHEGYWRVHVRLPLRWAS
ncbi:sensor histidine kinase [Embleya scabrispora]|uniref:sensor histidine kinase n=1 Tax=Embleya scabrispora TaxID=159449 RepID=UPI0003A1FB7C|nr:histidine kinase [Embleya scabrispora]MYS83665.1 two-component sensor histidine kinase [Streptomyces sp. SID5474]